MPQAYTPFESGNRKWYKGEENNMKVLLFNGSTRTNGCTYLALSEISKTLEQEGIETEILQLGAQPVWDCIGCNA